MEKSKKDKITNCPTCGVLCKVVKTCDCWQSGCDGSPKLVPIPMLEEDKCLICGLYISHGGLTTEEKGEKNE